MLALLPCQGKKHVCFPPRHTQGAHHVACLPTWWSILAFVRILAAGTIRLNDEGEGSARWMMTRRECTAVAGTRYDVMKQRGEPWAKLSGGRGVVEARVVHKLWCLELKHMYPTCHMTAPQVRRETSRATCYGSPTYIYALRIRHYVIVCMLSQNFLISYMEVSAPRMGSSAKGSSW